MNIVEAGLIDVYENVEKRLGDKAWVLPYAVALGSFLIEKAVRHRPTGKSLVAATMTGITTASLIHAGKTRKAEAAIAPL